MTEELLWELMLQVGPVVNVHMPKDKVTMATQGYGFVEFRTEASADYCCKVLNMVKLYDKPIRVNKSSQDKKSREIGANLFVGNLDPEVDEKMLYDTFSAFGGITSTPTIMRDPDTGNSKGFGFVNFDSFEASDLAIECMNGQFLCNRSIGVQYAYKKNSQGERHGSQAERLLAANNPDRMKPNTLFGTSNRPLLLQGNNGKAPPMPPMPPGPPGPPGPPQGRSSNGMPPLPPPPPGVGGFGNHRIHTGSMPPLPPRGPTGALPPAPPRPTYGAPTLPPNMNMNMNQAVSRGRLSVFTSASASASALRPPPPQVQGGFGGFPPPRNALTGAGAGVGAGAGPGRGPPLPPPQGGGRGGFMAPPRAPMMGMGMPGMPPPPPRGFGFPPQGPPPGAGAGGAPRPRGPPPMPSYGAPPRGPPPLPRQ